MSSGAIQKPAIREVLPKAGLVYSEKSTLSEVLSKPKIMPIKSITLERLEAMEKEAKKLNQPAAQQPGGNRNMSSGDRPTSAGHRPTSATGRPK